jgi:hypothetical protein
MCFGKKERRARHCERSEAIQRVLPKSRQQPDWAKRIRDR